jgi:hypothetical protein
MADYAKCPYCGGSKATKMSFTWWGGALGPALLTHVKCQDCRMTYNGKTGQPNTVGIITYSIVAFVIGVAIFVALVASGALRTFFR